MITVIIPYYQRETGILSKALASIAAQKDAGMPVHVLIVDDASPISAEAELPPMASQRYSVRVIKQPNGGPGSARNTGLDNAPPGTRYIAFLDSDDVWADDHLLRAATALQAGHDFYFADLLQLGASISAFSRAGRINPSAHPSLPGAENNLHAYQGDLLDQIIRGNVIGTSTVVYDFQKFNNNRFKVEFTNAGEDYLFWMDIAHSGAKIAFSSQCEAYYGKGVNIYAGTGWGTDKHLLRIHNEMKYRKLTCQIFPVNALQKKHIDASINDLRIAFAKDLLHRLAHRKKISLSLLRAHFQLDPLSFLLMPFKLLGTFIASPKK